MKNIFKIIVLCIVCLSFGIVAHGQITYIPGTTVKPGLEAFLSGVRYAVIQEPTLQTDDIETKKALSVLQSSLEAHLKSIGLYVVEEADEDLVPDWNDVVFVMIDPNFTWRFAQSETGYPYSWHYRFNNIRCFFYSIIGFEWIVSVGAADSYNNSVQSAFKVIKRYPYNSAARVVLPKQQTVWSESRLKTYFQTNGIDAIEGIYEHQASDHRVALIKNKNQGVYFLIYLTGASNPRDWAEGEVQATLIETATPFFYKATWITPLKKENQYYFVSLEQGRLTVIDDQRENEIYIKMYPAVSDNVHRSDMPPMGVGTGFFISRNGFFVTNNHVIEDAETIIVTGLYQDFDSFYEARVVTTDPKNDLAVLQIIDPDFEPFPTPIPYTLKSSLAEVGENCFTIGYPMIFYTGIEPKVTSGIISARTGYMGDVSLYQISASIQRGNSGGPLFDKNGNVIGVVNSGYRNYEDVAQVGYAVKTNYLMSLIESLPYKPALLQENMLTGQDLPSQIAQISDFICLVIVNMIDVPEPTDSTDTTDSTSTQTPLGTIENVWFEPVATKNGVQGMGIHVKFSVNGMKNKQGQCAAWFYYENGNPLILAAPNGAYTTADNQVAVNESFLPNSDAVSFDDFVLFIPYSAFPCLGEGTFNLKFQVGIIDHNLKEMAASSFGTFTMSW